MFSLTAYGFESFWRNNKGLSVTYQTLDEECPKTEESITNRTELAKYLHIEKLLKQNKEQQNPLRTMLEVIAEYLMQRNAATDYNQSENTMTKSSPSSQPTRPKSRITASLTHNAKCMYEKNLDNITDEAGMLIEDDLDTELMIGRGMEDVLHHHRAPEVAPPLQQRPHRSRRSRRMYQQHSQEEQADESNTEIKYPSQRVAGNEEISSNEQTTPSIDNASLDDKVTTPNLESPVLADDSISPSGSSANGEGSRPCSSSTSAQEANIEANGAEDILKMETTEPETFAPSSVSNDSENSSTLVPRPPLKMPDYLESSVKSGVEKSMELLRQRRLTQQLAEKVLRDLETEAITLESAEQKAVEQEGAGQTVDLATGQEEDSYSPRIIYSPIELTPDLVPTQEPVMSKKPVESKSEETITKQTASFMSVKAVISTAKSIDIQTASELKRLVLGSASLTFYEDWLCQGLGFCDLPDLLYGIIQHRPGPCGLLSVVQAYFILELLFCNELTKDQPLSRKFSPRVEVRSKILASAISKLLWKCGEEKRAVLALPSGSTIISGGGRFKSDGITETLMVNIVDNYEDVLKYTLRFLPYFEDDDSSGAILLLYSAVLSRGIEQVRDDMDSAETSLITNVGFCSPELVNLLVCGKAASNIFNDCMEITQGLGKTVLLKGIPSRSSIGLLSLLEHTNRRYKIGTFLKTPKFPIWICLIEDHYSLVFCLNKELISDWKAEKHFDLLYYDPFYKHDKPIRLTLDTTSRFFVPPDDDDAVPPLELCLRTKWQDAQINWNGTEPIIPISKDTSLLDEFLL